MRKIQELLQGGNHVWFYLKNAEIKRQFAAQMNAMGAVYLNGAPITPENCSTIMAIHSDGRAAHLMLMIWNASFHPDFAARYHGDTGRIIKVDYERYASGNDDYLCTKSEFIRIG